MGKRPQHRQQAGLVLAALIGAVISINLLAAPAQLSARGHSGHTAQIGEATRYRPHIAQPTQTAGTLVTPTPIVLNGEWRGEGDAVTIAFRVNGPWVEDLELTYRYGESLACGTDPAYRDILVRSSGSDFILPLEGQAVRGSLTASYTVGGIRVEGSTLTIEGALALDGSARGTINFSPGAGPSIGGGVGCLEERSAIAWSAALVSLPAPASTLTPTTAPPAKTMTAAPVPSAAATQETMWAPELTPVTPPGRAEWPLQYLLLGIGMAVLGVLVWFWRRRARVPLADIRQALLRHVSPKEPGALETLARALYDGQKGSHALKNADVRPEVWKELAGKKLRVRNKVFDFGDASQLGDVSIRDVAGGNMIKININVIFGGTQHMDK